MKTVPYQFLLGCTEAGNTLRSDRAQYHDVVWPAVMSWESLGRQLLLLFLLHEDLQSVSLTCLLQPAIDTTEDRHHIALNQHIKLSTTGGAVFAHLDEKLEFLGKHVPFHRMGSGTFRLERTDTLVTAILADPSSSDVDPLCYRLARRLLGSFKAIDIDVCSGQLLG